MGDQEAACESRGHYRSLRARAAGRSSTSRRQFGGVFAELAAAGFDPSLARQARRALARLIEGGEQESGPRYNWQQFCERLRTARPLAPARREEEGRPAILLLADVSGSCSSVATESLVVARAVASLGVAGAEVLLVSHSNGYPQEVQCNQASAQPVTAAETTAAALAWYAPLLRRHRVELVVALGDWDAAWLYRWLVAQSAVRRLLWLDVWSSSRMEPAPRPDKLAAFAAQSGEAWPRSCLRKACYVVACGSAGDFLAGLELAVRRG